MLIILRTYFAKSCRKHLTADLIMFVILFTARPAKFCTAYPNAIIHSPLACAQYFDCSSKVTMLGNYKKECPYPQLFDATTKTCKPYDIVDCGRRFIPVEPCKSCYINGSPNSFIIIIIAQKYSPDVDLEKFMHD